MLDRLVDEEARLLARPFLAEQRHERRLSGMCVLAGALARGGFVAAEIDEVVGDLECEADVARIATIRRPRLIRQLGHDARRLDRIFDQRAGLELLQPGDRRDIEGLPFGDEVHHLPAGHSARSGGAGKLEHQLAPHPRIVVRGRMREDVERERVQAIAGEHRLRLAERLVDGQLAAPQVRVVHARQIVVDQRINVDRLDRAADAERPLRIDREQARRGDGEHRAEPLAAADCRVAHRLKQSLAAVTGRRQQPREEIVDVGADPRRLSLQLAGRAVDRLNRHRTA